MDSPPGPAAPPAPAGPTDADLNRARARGRRAGHIVLVVAAVLFIGSSAAQIIPAVFGRRRTAALPGGAVGVDDPAAACARGVRALALALDQATGAAWSAVGAGEFETAPAIESFERALSGRWSEYDAQGALERACAATPAGLDAWASLLRLRRAEEQVLLRDRVDLAPPRRDVGAHLSGDLR